MNTGDSCRQVNRKWEHERLSNSDKGEVGVVRQMWPDVEGGEEDEK